jgi:hypothetical protein
LVNSDTCPLPATQDTGLVEVVVTRTPDAAQVRHHHCPMMMMMMPPLMLMMMMPPPP